MVEAMLHGLPKERFQYELAIWKSLGVILRVKLYAHERTVLMAQGLNPALLRGRKKIETGRYMLDFAVMRLPYHRRLTAVLEDRVRNKHAKLVEPVLHEVLRMIVGVRHGLAEATRAHGLVEVGNDWRNSQNPRMDDVNSVKKDVAEAIERLEAGAVPPPVESIGSLDGEAVIARMYGD